MQPVARLKRTIGDLLRDKSLLETCRHFSATEIAEHVTHVLHANDVPVRKIEVTPLPPGEDCRYSISYEFEESGEVFTQRFFRRSA